MRFLEAKFEIKTVMRGCCKETQIFSVIKVRVLRFKHGLVKPLRKIKHCWTSIQVCTSNV